jgi:hypothetical protein
MSSDIVDEHPLHVKIPAEARDFRDKLRQSHTPSPCPFSSSPKLTAITSRLATRPHAQYVIPLSARPVPQTHLERGNRRTECVSTGIRTIRHRRPNRSTDQSSTTALLERRLKMATRTFYRECQANGACSCCEHKNGDDFGRVYTDYAQCIEYTYVLAGMS